MPPPDFLPKACRTPISFFPRFFFLVLIASLATAAAPPRLTVATAASVQFAMEDLMAAFTKASGHSVQAVYGASGALVTQIRNGAPFHVFVSADSDFPDSLQAAGHTSGAPRVYGYGTLVLWTTRDLDLSRGVAGLADPAFATIALADVRRAPFGREADRALRRAGVHAAVEARLVYGENISQVTQYVLTGNADVGFNAKSVVTARQTRGRGAWVEVDPALYEPVAQAAVVTRAGAREHPRAAEAFLDFLFSTEGRAILVAHGYALHTLP